MGRGVRVEGEQQGDLPLLVLVVCPFPQDALVRAIEGHDEVVVREGRGGELAGAVLGAVVTATGQGIDRAVIGALAEMPVACSGAARDDARAESLPLGEVAEDDLGHGRAADVPRADEDHAEGIRGCHTYILPGRGPPAQRAPPRAILCTP